MSAFFQNAPQQDEPLCLGVTQGGLTRQMDTVSIRGLLATDYSHRLQLPTVLLELVCWVMATSVHGKA